MLICVFNIFYQGRKVKTELDSREIDADLAAISNVGKNSYFDISEASTSSGISSTSMKPPVKNTNHILYQLVINKSLISFKAYHED